MSLQLANLVTQGQAAFFHAAQAQLSKLTGQRDGQDNPCIQVGMLDLPLDQLALGRAQIP
jgi:hypothetical protein